MHKLYWVFCLLLLVSCHKRPRQYDTFLMTPAVISGDDPRMCVCCGGLIIYFKDNNNIGDYRVANAETLHLPNNPKFPINLYAEWQFVPACGGHLYVQIDRFSIR